jgi:hypothetical protein
MNLNTEPSIGASHQVLVHLAKQFQGRRFLALEENGTQHPRIPTSISITQEQTSLGI